MSRATVPWDQRAARALVRPLVGTRVTPNHLTAVSLAVGLAGACLLATGDPRLADWGAGLFAAARFLDHLDGELARQSARASRFGYYFDYVAGGLSYAALFAGIGIGLWRAEAAVWPLALGAVAALVAVAAMFLNLDIDAHTEGRAEGDSVGYPGWGGFELEDGIYLIAPVTWLGLLIPFFALAGAGACVYGIWTASRLVALRVRGRG